MITQTQTMPNNNLSIEEICKRAIELPSCPVKRADAIARRVRLKRDIDNYILQLQKPSVGPTEFK